MIRPWERFGVISAQVDITAVDVVRRSRGMLVAEISTRQKYCIPLAWSGMELHLVCSEDTRRDSYDNNAPASTIVFPRQVRGWEVVAPGMGRYSMQIVLFKPGRRRHHASVAWDEQRRLDLYQSEIPAEGGTA